MDLLHEPNTHENPITHFLQPWLSQSFLSVHQLLLNETIKLNPKHQRKQVAIKLLKDAIVGGVLRTLSNIYDGTFCQNS